MAKKPQPVKKDEMRLSFFEEKDIDEANNFINDIFDIISENIEIRKKLIDVEVHGQYNTMNYGQLLVGLIVSKVYFVFDRQLTVNDIPVFSKNDNVPIMVKKFFDKLIRTYDGNDFINLKSEIAKSLELMSTLMYEFNVSKGNTLNLYDLFKIMHEDKEVRDIINFNINENHQFAVMEESVVEQCNKLIKKFYEHGENCYIDIIRSISVRQFQQVFVNISLKPDLYGKIYPTPINTSFVRGMRNSKDFFINAMGARKSLITNNTFVRSAGYLSRKLSLLVLNQKLSDIEDCHSPYPVYMDIDSKSILERFNGRNHIVGKGTYELIDKEDLSLVGTRLKIRSPITCTLPGSDICRVCYGNLSKINNLHIGLSGVLILTEQIIQSLLSSKHLLQVNAAKIDLPKELSHFFKIDKDSLLAKEDLTITFETPLENEDTGQFYIDTFTVFTKGGEEKVISLDALELLVEPIEPQLNLNNNDETVVVLEDMEVFRLNIENTELSTPLKNLLKKLESEEKLNEVGSITFLLLDLLKLLDKANISSAAVNIELILREMLRDSDNIQERPLKFGSNDNYKFLRLQNALLHNKSAAITLAFERIKYVIENNIFRKNAESILDTLY